MGDQEIEHHRDFIEKLTHFDLQHVVLVGPRFVEAWLSFVQEQNTAKRMKIPITI